MFSLDLMRAHFLLSSVIVLALYASAAAASEESPHDLAVRIISSGPAAVYQPTNSTDEEKKRAARFNAEPQLQQFMLSDAVPEDIRVCYAMHVLVERLVLARDLSNSKLANAYREDLNRSYDALGEYLRSLKEHRESTHPSNQ